ncbi:MAG: glycosyltransferase [Gaiellaceae bacterium MAG52_C11]|nr:glycosyltransferase [Candidatus Gaiellasilicea maunaloa]
MSPDDSPRGVAISIVIPTYRRPELVRRAVASAGVLRAGDEIVVVDDGSPEDVAAALAGLPGVRLVRQENAGVGPARNRGLAEAANEWVLVVDDDDELTEGALDAIRREIPDWEAQAAFPVLTFASSNAWLPFEGRRPLTFEDYALGRFRGDLIPLIHRPRFRAAGYEYPDTRVGGEHLLWYRIAAEATIPASSLLVVRKHDDAEERLTSGEAHLRRAREHAELQEETLTRFGAALRELSPAAYARRRLGAATFRLLCGDRAGAREHLRRSELPRLDRRRLGLWLATLLPDRLVSGLFVRYRRRQWTRAVPGSDTTPQ